jgi:hypothetical protein
MNALMFENSHGGKYPLAVFTTELSQRNLPALLHGEAVTEISRGLAQRHPRIRRSEHGIPEGCQNHLDIFLSSSPCATFAQTLSS